MKAKKIIELIFIGTIIAYFAFSEAGYAYWNNYSYPYRINASITGISATTSNYQTFIEVNMTTEANYTHFFTYANETNMMITWYNSTSGTDNVKLNYWIKKFNSTNNITKIWINATTVATTGSLTHIYYGLNDSNAGINNSNYSKVFLPNVTELANITLDSSGAADFHNEFYSMVSDGTNLYVSGYYDRQHGATSWYYQFRKYDKNFNQICANLSKWPTSDHEAEGYHTMVISSDGTKILGTGRNSNDFVVQSYNSTCNVTNSSSWSIGSFENGFGVLFNGTDQFAYMSDSGMVAGVIKYNSSMNHIWNTTWSVGTLADDTMGSILMSDDKSKIIAIYGNYSGVSVRWLNSTGSLVGNYTAGFTNGPYVGWRVWRAARYNSTHIVADAILKNFTTGDYAMNVFMMNESGSISWNVTLNSTSLGAFDIGYGVSVDDFGNVLATGIHNGAMTLVKINSTGSVIWWNVKSTIAQPEWYGDYLYEVIPDLPDYFTSGGIYRPKQGYLARWGERLKVTTEPTITLSGMESTPTDISPPTITGEDVNASTGNISDSILINASITDNINVSEARFYIETPDGNEMNLTASNASSNYFVICNSTNACRTNVTGTYQITSIWANDTNGNNATKLTSLSFTIEGNASIRFVNTTRENNNTNARLLGDNGTEEFVLQTYTNVNNITISIPDLPDGEITIQFGENYSQTYQFIKTASTGEIDETLYTFVPEEILQIVVSDTSIGHLQDATIWVYRITANGTEKIHRILTDSDGNAYAAVNESDYLVIIATAEGHETYTKVIKASQYLLNGYDIRMDVSEGLFERDIRVSIDPPGKLLRTPSEAAPQQIVITTASTEEHEYEIYRKLNSTGATLDSASRTAKTAYFSFLKTNALPEYVEIYADGILEANLTIEVEELSYPEPPSISMEDNIGSGTTETAKFSIAFLPWAFLVIAVSAATKMPKESYGVVTMLFSFYSSWFLIMLFPIVIIIVAEATKEMRQR